MNKVHQAYGEISEERSDLHAKRELLRSRVDDIRSLKRRHEAVGRANNDSYLQSRLDQVDRRR
jgi:hypothetical protein